MKNLAQIAILAFMLIFAASCGNNEVVKVEKPEPTCHVELVHTSLTSSVIAVEYRVQEGQKPEDIVQMHKTDPNMVGGPFLDYTMDMFLVDNPEVISTTKRSIRKDKCDPEKLDTAYYKSWSLKEHDLVYLRIPARLDTIPGAGWNAEWFTPEKISPIKHLVGRIEITSSNLEKKPVVDRRENPCESGAGVITPPSPDDEGGLVFPPNGGDGDKPVDSGDSSRFSDFFGNVPNWFWLLLALAFLCWFFYYQLKKTREAVNGHTSKESTKTREYVSGEHGKTREHASTESKNNLSMIEESMKNLGSNLSQAIANEGKADREMLERQLNAERKSQEKRDAQYFKALKGPKEAGGGQS